MTHTTSKNFFPYPHLLCAALLILGCVAVGCPSSGPESSPPDPPKTTAEAPDVGAASQKADTAEPKTDTKEPSTPADGSLEVKDAGPPAPTLFFLAGLKGYTEPCGCTLDVMVGGLDRIVGYLDVAKTKAKGSLMLDAGNMLFDLPSLETHRIAQEQAKADVIVKAHLQLGTVSTTPGPNDFALGKHFYLDKVRGSGIEILVANLKEDGDLPLGSPHMVHDLEGTKVGVIGLVDPSLFAGIEGLKVSDPVEAAKASVKALKKEGVHSIVAVYHAGLRASKDLLEAVPDIHFVVVGYEPRETDAVDKAGNGYTLEAYDQGRYLGILKLYPRGQTPPTTFTNARAGSKSEKERLDRRMAQVEAQIERMPAATPGDEPPFLKKLREQLNALKKEKENLSTTAITMPDDKTAAFIYRSVALEPGYPINDTMAKEITAFNKTLEKINSANTEPIPPVPEGEAEYIGTERCATCHVAAHDVWTKTAHAKAIKTLISRNKVFDKNCIGCHVTGYRKPGGSVLGKLEYTATVGGQGFTKKLQNVGCEVCHGPGSKHATSPVNSAGKPHNITRQVPDSLCVDCHNSSHSPRFNYPVYVEQITGEGHTLAKPPGKP